MTASAMPPWLAAAAAKASGLELAATNTEEWWRICADAGIEQLAATGRRFTAFDLIELGVPEPDHPCRWGARFSAAAKAGVITAVGYTASRRPRTAQSAVRVWQGAAAARAEVPEVAAVLESKGHTVLVRCPFCRKQHVHGVNGGDDYGPRLSHCHDREPRTYLLVPAQQHSGAA